MQLQFVTAVAPHRTRLNPRKPHMLQAIVKYRSVIAPLAILACLGHAAQAQTASPSAPTPPQPRGTVCTHYVLNAPDDVPVITCKGIGKILSVAELYERGYRVVSATQATGTGQGVVFIYIEERK